jgi:sn-glycerol 3-phosphate transport system permease protein
LVERTPLFDILTHVVLITGLAITLLPIILALIAASHPIESFAGGHVPLIPSDRLWDNVVEAWTRGRLGREAFNSFVMATGVALGKMVLASLSAFAIVYFRFPLRMAAFWAIFVTLMLPLEVRIVPTYAVAANALEPFQAILDWTRLSDLIELVSGLRVSLEWNLLDSYTGLSLPLIATATGTFLFRQFFMTVPDELTEAAKVDGASPMRFFRDTLVPLSRTNFAALATIMFVYTWNQYLWPLLITTDPDMRTIVVGLERLMPTVDTPPVWNVAMAGALLTLLPPVLVVILMQRWFVRGLINTDK